MKNGRAVIRVGRFFWCCWATEAELVPCSTDQVAELANLHQTRGSIRGNCYDVPIALPFVVEGPLRNSIGLELYSVLPEKDADTPSTEVSIEDLVGTMKYFGAEDMLFRTSATKC